MEEFHYIINRENGCCLYCNKSLDKTNLTLDRIDNEMSHTFENVVLCCVDCNRKRKDRDYEIYVKESAYHRCGGENKFIWLIDNEKTYNTIKQSNPGGPSIIFTRYHESGKTMIRKLKYCGNNTWSYPKNGKTVKKILGFDANALYLYCLAQKMMC